MRHILAADEQERADRFVFEHDRQHYTVGRGFLRQILGRYVGLEPAQLRFSYGPQGKPDLADSRLSAALRFNLSHSKGLALVGLTQRHELGIDIEGIRTLDDMDKIAERFFSAAENVVYAQVPAALKSVAFFNCWTRKEAYIKAIGEGLSHPLDTFDVTLAPGAPARLLRAEKDPQAINRWSLMTLEPAPGYIGALAVAGQNLRVSSWALGLRYYLNR